MRVSDVLTRGVECTSPEASLREAAAKMKRLDVGTLPVCDQDRLVGMITDRDITVRATASGEDPAATCVHDVMSPEVVYCFEDDSVDDAAHVMQEKKIRRLVVLDQDKQLVGIVSLGDLAVETGDEQMAGSTLESISEPNRPVR